MEHMSNQIGVTVLCYVATEDCNWIVHRRGKECKTPGVFNFVSGKLEPDEQPEEAAYREVCEEYGCEPQFIVPLAPHQSLVESERETFRWLVLPFYARINSGDLRPSKREVSDLTIIPCLDEIPSPQHPGLMPSLERNRIQLEKLNRP
jgi:8-oxo-dGTP pyrophosphatase MutT (NUDIX family)